MELMTLELLASSTTHCLMEASRGEPGCRLRVSGGMCSAMATESCRRKTRCSGKASRRRQCVVYEQVNPVPHSVKVEGVKRHTSTCTKEFLRLGIRCPAPVYVCCVLNVLSVAIAWFVEVGLWVSFFFCFLASVLYTFFHVYIKSSPAV